MAPAIRVALPEPGPARRTIAADPYADFVEALRDAGHERHVELRRWAGPKFDPERFDLDETNKAIAKALRRARGGYRFRRER